MMKENKGYIHISMNAQKKYIIICNLDTIQISTVCNFSLKEMDMLMSQHCSFFVKYSYAFLKINHQV